MTFRSISRTLVWGVLLCVGSFAAGCGGGETTPEDVDENTPVAITEAEYDAFDAPADSVLTDDQVEQYLKTSLLQFDLIRKHSERIHERVDRMEKRDQEGGAMAGLRNMMDAGRTVMEFGNVVGGSFIRSARTLGYNPAEMEWVRERMTETASYMAYAPAREGMLQGAQEARAGFEAMRDAEGSGYSAEEIEAMLQNVDEMERSLDTEPAGAVARNIAVLHRARPNVTDEMWTAIGLSTGAMGLMGLSGLADPNDEEAQAKLDEFRTLYTDALENRVTPGMEREG